MNNYWDTQWAQGYDANMGGGAAQTYWADEGRARYYDNEVCKEDWVKGRNQMACIPHRATDTALDIGAGPCSLAIPLSREVRHVTAIEPSPAMNACAMKHIERHRLRNLTLVEKSWEETDITKDLDAPYDLVICSYSLGMRDIRAALLKMHDACGGTVHLFWHLGPRIPEAELSAILKGKGLPFWPIPKANIIFNILYDMGIYPQVSVQRREVRQEFASMRDACDLYRGKHNLSRPVELGALRDAMGQLLTATRKGTYELRTVWHSAHLSWQAGKP